MSKEKNSASVDAGTQAAQIAAAAVRKNTARRLKKKLKPGKINSLYPGWSIVMLYSIPEDCNGMSCIHVTGGFVPLSAIYLCTSSDTWKL